MSHICDDDFSKLEYEGWRSVSLSIGRVGQNLTTVHLKGSEGNISALCGCIIAVGENK